MLKGFLDSVGPPVLKAARGGYDGRGVLFPQSRAETIAMIDELCSHDERGGRRATQSARRAGAGRRARRERRVRQLSPGVDGAVPGACAWRSATPPMVDEDTAREADRLGTKDRHAGGRRGRAGHRVLRERPRSGRQRDRPSPAQHGTLDDRGRAHQSVHQSPVGRERPRAGIDRGDRCLRR